MRFRCDCRTPDPGSAPPLLSSSTVVAVLTRPQPVGRSPFLGSSPHSRPLSLSLGVRSLREARERQRLGLAGAAVTLVLFACVLLALRHRVALRLLNRIAARAASWSNRTWRRSGTEPIPALDSFFEEIASIKLPALYLAEVTLFLLWNWVGDCRASGLPFAQRAAAIPWHALFLAYGAIGAAVVTLTPGGVGCHRGRAIRRPCNVRAARS
jgi:hypothetical protein